MADLVFETKYSPRECQKFLNKIAVELDADINYTESGKLYYKFPIADNLELKQKEKYEKLIRYTESCANYNNGIVTVVDLSFKAELSPTECKEFLDDFITEIKGEVEITEQGHFYYKLPTAKSIELKKLKGDK
ncbi:MAG: hypothetical protein AB4206_03325 [Xenococcaceae cyanobacterium]